MTLPRARAAFLALGLLLPPRAGADALRFEVRLSPELVREPLDGRLLLMI